MNGASLPSGVGVFRAADKLRVYKGVQRKTVSCAGLSEGARLFSLEAALGLFEDSAVSRLSPS